jgi:hypothetical protein
MRGRRTLAEQAKKMVMSPVNKVGGAAIPFEKMLLESLMRRSVYPDLTKPRTIRDRSLYIAQSLGLENEYKALTGKPTRGYKESIKNFAIYTSDSKESSYYYALELRQKFLEKKGKPAPEGFWITAKGSALYNYKIALRYKDKDAADKYLLEYKMLGGTAKGLVASLKSMSIGYGMKGLANEFLASLSVEDREKVMQGMEFYSSVLATNLDYLNTDDEDAQETEDNP